MNSRLFLFSNRSVTFSVYKRYVQSQIIKSETEKQYSGISKIVNVAIIGAPNSGKSTLINQIVGRKVCAASNKVHTTLNLVRAICIEEDTQIIFLDTPGIVSEKEQKRYDLPQSMTKACDKSLRVANIVGVVQDVSNKWTKDSLHKQVLQTLQSAEGIPAFLILNKVDLLKSKKHLLTIIRNLTNGFIAGNPIPGAENRKEFDNSRGYDKFSDVFMVSALTGDGVEDIKEYLKQNAKNANPHYSETDWTDQKPEGLVLEAIRAKFLDFLPQEIPYKLKPVLEYYEELDEKIVCSVAVYCPSDRILRLIGGAGGGRLNQIKNFARYDLINMFQKHVSLDIVLKVRNL